MREGANSEKGRIAEQCFALPASAIFFPIRYSLFAIRPFFTSNARLQLRYRLGGKFVQFLANLNRIFDGGQPEVLLTECTFLQFGTFQRNTTPSLDNAFVPVATSQPNLCKVVQLTWICTRKILGKTANTESVQSAKVVIRKK